MSLPELTKPVDLCGPDGRLAAAAMGWSRRPWHRCNLSGADVSLARRGLQLSFSHRPGVTRLRGAIEGRLTADVSVDRSGESLNAVVPWSGDRFAFTCQHFALSAAGSVTAAGKRHDLSFACLDFGRGVWPYRSEWFWASVENFRARW